MSTVGSDSRVLYPIEEIRAILMNEAKCKFALSQAKAKAREYKPAKIWSNEYPHWLNGMVARELEAQLVSKVEADVMRLYLRYQDSVDED